MKTQKTPEDFRVTAFDSVWQKSECETIATNVMVILSRTGDVWRKLTWDEYKKERLKDNNFTETEHQYFEKVIDFCVSPETARTVCIKWKEVYEK